MCRFVSDHLLNPNFRWKVTVIYEIADNNVLVNQKNYVNNNLLRILENPYSDP